MEHFKIIGCDDIVDNDETLFDFTSNELSLDVEVKFIGLNCIEIRNKLLTTDWEECDHGLLPIIANNNNDNYGKMKTYKISVKNSNIESQPILSITDELNVIIGGCNLGDGQTSNLVSNGSVQCSTCLINQFKMDLSTKQCYTCDTNVRKVSCLGGYTINIEYNYWIGSYNLENHQLMGLTNISTNDYLFTGLCAPLHCCQHLDGCWYINENQNINPQICADGRQYTSPLCTQCQSGKYELFGSSACGSCNEYNFPWLSLIFVLSFFFVLFIFFIDATEINIKPYKAIEINWKKLLIFDESKAINIMIFRIVTYNYQSLSQILSARGINHSFIPILAFFDVSFDYTSSSKLSFGICIIPYLNSLNEIIFGLIFVIFILFHSLWILIVAVIRKMIKQNRISLEKEVSNAINNNEIELTTQQQQTTPKLNKKIEPDFVNTIIPIAKSGFSISEYCTVISKKKPIYLMGFLKIFLIISGSICKMAFKLMSCTSLPNSKIVYLYSAEQECFGFYWVFGLICILLTVILYILLFRIIYKQY
eukprot:14603_1